jgi:hypothetical protein
MKMKAIFEIEFEAEGGLASPRHLLQRALTRAERGLKEIVTGTEGNCRGFEVRERCTHRNKAKLNED